MHNLKTDNRKGGKVSVRIEDSIAKTLPPREARKYSEALEVGSPLRTIQQVCAIMQCSESGLRNLKNDGLLVPRHIPRVGVRYDIHEVEAFIRRYREGGAA